MKLYRLKGIFFCSLGTSTTIGQLIYIFLSIQNGKFSEGITTISELSTNLIMTAKAFIWAFRGYDIASIIQDIGDLDKRRKKYFANDIHTDSIMDAHTKTCSHVFNSYMLVGSLIALHWAVRPLVNVFHGDFSPMTKDWIPWDDTTLIGWFLHCIYSDASLFGGVAAWSDYDSIMISYYAMSIGLIDSISYGLSTLKFENADVRHRLRELHEMHKDAIFIMKKVSSFTNIIIQAEVVLFTSRMCCGALEITHDWTSTAKKMNTIENFSFCAVYFFIQCYFSQTATAKFMSVGSAAYDNDWYNGAAEEKLSLSIIVETSRKPIEVGSIIRINVSNFIALMKTSFSYYSTLKVLDIR